MFWALLRLILARAARRKRYYYYYHLEDIEEINTEKMTTKESEEHFFHQRCEKTSTNLEMAYDYLILTFYLANQSAHYIGYKRKPYNNYLQ